MEKLREFRNKFLSFMSQYKGEDVRFSKDYLALVRIGCLGVVFLGIIHFIILLNIFHQTIYALALSFLILGMLCLFIVSYFQRKHFFIMITLFCIIEMLMLTLFTLWFGTTIGYHIGVLILVFVVFYQTDNRKYKYFEFFISMFFIIYSFGIWCFIVFNDSSLPVSKQDNLILSIGFLLWLGLNVVVLAWFYHVKFAKNEEDLLKYNDKLQEMTKRDTLTNLQNRRGLTEKINKLVKSSTDLYFIMCDIDFFKKVNDNYGHDIGDKVLVRVAEILLSNVGKDGQVGRWGGEEFLIVIPNKTQQQVLDLMEHIRMTIARETFVIAEHKEFFVTMTFGISEHYFTKYTVEESIKRADENLYLGKQHGRNCVMF